MKHLFYKFINRGIEWLFRLRHPGLSLVGSGVAIFLATFGMNFFAQGAYSNGAENLSFKFTTGDGAPMWASVLAYILSIVLMVSGLVIVILREKQERKKAHRQRFIVIELRGLHASPDTPAVNADLGAVLGERHSLPIDFRPNPGAMVDPAYMLERISSIQPTIATLTAGKDKSDVYVAVGGLAAIPGLFLTGMLLDDESHVTLYDWDRNAKAWHLIEGADDGKRFLPLDTSELPFQCEEVVLTVAVSYPIDVAGVQATFAGMPVVRLTAQETLADRYWSSEKQQALVVAFRDAVQELMSRGVRKIHLILAAPSSPTIRMGMAYDRRLLPDIVVYQYERTASPPYPWGILMPTHGRKSASIVWMPETSGLPIT